MNPSDHATTSKTLEETPLELELIPGFKTESAMTKGELKAFRDWYMETVSEALAELPKPFRLFPFT